MVKILEDTDIVVLNSMKTLAITTFSNFLQRGDDFEYKETSFTELGLGELIKIAREGRKGFVEVGGTHYRVDLIKSALLIVRGFQSRRFRDCTMFFAEDCPLIFSEDNLIVAISPQIKEDESPEKREG